MTKGYTTQIAAILQNRVYVHLLFWLAILVGYPLYAYALFGQPVGNAFLVKLLYLPPQIAAAYLLVDYQIPRFIYRKKYGQFALSFLVSLYVFSTLFHLIDDFLVNPLAGIGHERHTFREILLYTFPSSAFHIIFVYLIPFILAGGKMVWQRLEQKQQLTRLEKEKTHAELQFLKAQIHPHFLFNTLDSLYDLSLKKSDAAPEVVIKLSEMLDYMLYDCNSERVPVGRELELIQHYIDLERLRLGESVQINFAQQIDAPSTPVAPLILLSLTEQAFKTISKNRNYKLIELELILRQEQLRFHFISKTPQNTPNKVGVALTDIQRQLDLLYPNQYQLNQMQNRDHFLFELKLDLCQHQPNA